jgi:hypothetical protein
MVYKLHHVLCFLGGGVGWEEEILLSVIIPLESEAQNHAWKELL